MPRIKHQIPTESADWRLVFHTAWGVTKDWHLAEDIAQEVLLTAASTDVPEFPAAKRAWLSRVTVNRSLSLLRSNSRRSAREIIRSEEPSEREETVGAAEASEKRENLQVVREALDSLDDSQRIPIVLRFFSEFKLREVAETLDVPVPTVQSRITAGLAQLERRLGVAGHASLAPVLTATLAAIPASSPVPLSGAAAGATVAAAGTGLFHSIKAKIAALCLAGAATAAVFADFDNAPYTGATAIVVHHGPDRSIVDRIDDPAALAEILGALEYTAFEPVIVAIRTATSLDFVRADGTTEPNISLIDATTMQGSKGLLHMSPAFLRALEDHLSKRHGRAIDLLAYVPSAKAPPHRWTMDGLASLRIASLKIRYRYGEKGMWVTKTHVPDGIKRLDAAFDPTLFLSREDMETKGIKADPIRFGGWRSELFMTSDSGEECSFWFCSPTRLYHFRVGLIDVPPAFAEMLAVVVSEAHGREMSLFVPNDPPLALRTAALAADAIFDGAKGAALADESGELGEGHHMTDLKGGPELSGLLDKRGLIQSPVQEHAARPIGHTMVLVGASGSQVAIDFLKPIDEGRWSSPLLSDLIEIDGQGRFWVSKSLRERARSAIRSAGQRKKDALALETSKEVVKDWSGFLDRVVSCQVTFGVGPSEYLTSLSGEDAEKLVTLLAQGTFEESHKSESWWLGTFGEAIARDPGTLDLIPGTNYRLTLFFTSDRTAIVPGVGRLTLPDDGWKVLREILAMGEDYGPDAVRLTGLPASKRSR